MVFTRDKPLTIEIPPPISYNEWILTHLRKHAADGKIALVWADNGAEISYADLLRETVQAAAGLQAMGAKSGDKMSFVTRNSPEIYSLVFGCIMSDVVVVPSVAESSAHELRQNFILVQPQFVVTRPDKLEDIKKALDCDEITFKPRIICLDENTYKNILAKGSHADPKTFTPAKIEDPTTHVFTFLFSSGTTGKQKPIMLCDYPTIRNLYLASVSTRRDEGLVVGASQAHWSSWIFNITRSMIASRPFLFFTKNEVEDILEAIHKFKATSWYCTPAHLAGIIKATSRNPGRWDISSMKLYICASDALGEELHKEYAKALNVDIHQEYGSTEVGYVTAADMNGPMIYGSSGKPIIPIKLVNVDTEEEITKPNQIGEVRVQQSVMGGYYKNPEASAEAVDQNGWYRVGDLAYFNETNDLFIVDRIKEMLKYKGFQVPPSDLEDIIKSIPGVEDAGVAGKKDPTVGDIITAFVIKAPGSKITEKDVLDAYAKKNLHDSKQLRGGVIFMDELPKNSNTKLLRRKLADILNGTPNGKPETKS